jgi:4-amino-4-deoxy-L-arabinose transferase-like glycosyltransferase
MTANNLDNKTQSSKKLVIFLTILVSGALGIRFYFFPYDVPLTADALYYFLYSSDILHLNKLPDNWTPANNGWPILVSIVFTIFNSDDIFTLMQIQRALSVILSVLTIIPIFYLCKKFVSKEFAIIGGVIIAFDPRLMINSFLGITDSVYLLLMTTSLVLFLSSNKKMEYFSFILVGFCVLVRVEGMALFVILSIMYFIKYKNQGLGKFYKYGIMLGIFLLIIVPMYVYENSVPSIESSPEYLVPYYELGSHFSLDKEHNTIIKAVEIFSKYLIWILIPNFIIFLPLGIFMIFQNRNFEKKTIILSLGILALPAFYAYTIPALDTRYLYLLFPIFTVLSVIAIERISHKFKKKNIFIAIILLGIITSSLIFYDHLKVNYEHEKESFEITKKISTFVKGVNSLNGESSFFYSVQAIDEWPGTYYTMGGERIFGFSIIPTSNFDSLENLIIANKENGLTHIMVKNNTEQEKFIVEIFNNENKYTYLEKIYDSKSDGFDYHVKVFEIDYKKFSLSQNKN